MTRLNSMFVKTMTEKKLSTTKQSGFGFLVTHNDATNFSFTNRKLRNTPALGRHQGKSLANKELQSFTLRSKLPPFEIPRLGSCEPHGLSNISEQNPAPWKRTS